MPIARLFSRALLGIDAPLITIEVDLAPGLPCFTLVGLPEASVREARERVRSAIEATVTDQRLAGVLTGLVVGDQQAIHRADWDVFRATGVAHLMSISGLHITLWAWLAME